MKTQQQELGLGVRAADTETYHVACFFACLQGLMSRGSIDDFRVYPDGSIRDGTFTCWITFSDGSRKEWRTSDVFELDNISMHIKIRAAHLMQSWCPLDGEWTGIDPGSRKAIRTHIRMMWQPLAVYAYESFLTKGEGSIRYFHAPCSRTRIGRDCFYFRKPENSDGKVTVPDGWPRTFDPVKQMVFSVSHPGRIRYIVASPPDKANWPETIWAGSEPEQQESHSRGI